MLRSIIITVCLILGCVYGYGQTQETLLYIGDEVYTVNYNLTRDNKIEVEIQHGDFKSGKQIIAATSYDKFKLLLESYIKKMQDSTGKKDTTAINGLNNYKTEKTTESNTYEKDLAEIYAALTNLERDRKFDSLNNQMNEVAGRVILKDTAKGVKIQTYERLPCKIRINPKKRKAALMARDTLNETPIKVIDANIACVNNMLKIDVALEGFRDRLSLKYPISTKTNWTDMYVFGEKPNAGFLKPVPTVTKKQKTDTTKVTYEKTVYETTTFKLTKERTVDIYDTTYRITTTNANGIVIRTTWLTNNNTIRRDSTYMPKRIIVLTPRDSTRTDTSYALVPDTTIRLRQAPFNDTDDSIDKGTNFVRETVLYRTKKSIVETYSEDSISVTPKNIPADSIRVITRTVNDTTYKTDNKKYNNYKFRISDLLEFIPDTVSNRKYYNWRSFDSKKITAGNSLLVHKKNWLAEAINLTAFYDILTQVQAADANRNNDVPLQMELNLNIPIRDWNASRSTFWFPKMQTDVNFVPAGSKTGPYHLLDSANLYRSGKRSINFELLRDHNLNLATKLTVFRAMPTVKEFMFFDLNLGYRCFVTSIKTRDLLSTKNTGATGDSTYAGPTVAATSFIIGPELSLRYECVIDEWFGLDVNFGVNYLRRAVGVKRDVENLLEDYKYPNGKYYSRDMWTLSPEINMYFRIPGKKDLNPSGFMVRYRMYQDIGSVANPVHWILVGYSANLKTLFK